MKIGLTLMGGGMLSVAYAGALAALDESNIKPVAIVGSSGGAVVSACYAFGIEPIAILNHFRIFNIYSLFDLRYIFTYRQLNYQSWINHATKLVPSENHISEAFIKLAIHATSSQTRDSVFFRQGNASQAVIASSAIIGGFSFQGNYYYDGDYDPETGANVLKDMGAEYKILLNVERISANRIFPFPITQENALKSDLQIHPVDDICTISVKGDEFAKNYLEHNYQQGYEQMKSFIASKPVF